MECLPLNQPANSRTAELGNCVPDIRRAIPPEDRVGVTAIELVIQTADVFDGIEAHAAETKARAYDLAQRAADQLSFAERQIHALKSLQNAAEASLIKANARADEAEQVNRTIQAQNAVIEHRLATAEARAKNAEAFAIEAQKSLIRVEDAIRSQLLAKLQPPTGIKLAAAA
jgi:hypothetical protein